MIDDLTVPWSSPKIPSDLVARAAVRGLSMRRPEIIVPAVLKLLVVLNAASARFGDWLYRALKPEGRKG